MQQRNSVTLVDGYQYDSFIPSSILISNLAGEQSESRLGYGFAAVDAKVHDLHGDLIDSLEAFKDVIAWVLAVLVKIGLIYRIGLQVVD